MRRRKRCIDKLSGLQETALGAEPPSTLRSMNNLGLVLRDQDLGLSDQR